MGKPMNECLWCDGPTEEKLCTGCRKVHDHPLFHCTVSPRHLPTHGDSCAECDWIAKAEARRAAINAPILASLKAIREKHLADWHRPWPGMEFGKALFGQMVDGAIREVSDG